MVASTSSRRLPSFLVLPPLPADVVRGLTRAAATAALSAALLCPLPAPVYAAKSDTPPPNTVLPAPQIDAEHALAAETWGLVQRYFIDPSFGGADWSQVHNELQTTALRSRTDTYSALRKAISRLHDPYTRLLTPREMESLRKFDVSGVGLLLTTGSGDNVVVAAEPASGTAAAKAGIMRGDVLVAVDGLDIKGRDAFEVAQLMQGPDGEPMSLRFREAGDVVLTRQYKSEAKDSAISSFVVNDSGRTVGHIRLLEFRASARDDVAKAVRSLSAEGVDALVLDLRGNPGGVFEGALEIAGVFEGSGVPVAMVTSREKSADTYVSSIVGGAKPSTVPLAIVVDDRTASASEVLAGGLRSSCRAAIVGDTRSYGKGVIQGVFGLSDGSGLVLTVAEYTTPKGDKIQKVGLTPDAALGGSVLERGLRAVGIEGPAKVDWAEVERITRKCGAKDSITR